MPKWAYSNHDLSGVCRCCCCCRCRCRCRLCTAILARWLKLETWFLAHMCTSVPRLMHIKYLVKIIHSFNMAAIFCYFLNCYHHPIRNWSGNFIYSIHMWSCWAYHLTWWLVKIMCNFKVIAIFKKIAISIISSRVFKLQS